MNTIEKTEGIILGGIDHSRTSRIFSIYTEDFGKITLLAKGYYRPKSRSFDRVDLGSRVYIVFYRSLTNDIYTMSEMACLEHIKVSGWKAAAHTALALEILSKLTPEEEPDRNVFKLCARAFYTGGRAAFSSIWTLAFIVKMLKTQGFLPGMLKCGACGTVSRGLVIRTADELPLCSHCHGSNAPVSLTRNALAALNMFLSKPPASAPSFSKSLDRKDTAPIMRYVLNLAEFHGGTLKSRLFFNKIRRYVSRAHTLDTHPGLA